MNETATVFGGFRLSLFLRAATLGSMALSGLLLAKLMSPAQYGIYGHAMAIVSLAVILATAGTETFLLREIGGAGGRTMSRALRESLMGFCFRLVLCAAFLVGLALVMLLPLVGSTGAGQLGVSGRLSLGVLVVLLSLISVYKGAAKGDQRFVLAQFPDGVLRPWILMGTVLLFQVVGFTMSADLAIVLYLCAVFCALGVILAASRMLPDPMLSYGTSDPSWIRACASLLFVAAVMVLNRRLDVLMLGFMVEEEATGAYVLATRFADAITITLTAFSISYSAKCARWLKGQQQALLQQALRKATRGVFLVTAIGVLILWVIAFPVLDWFNPGYVQSLDALRVLISAQLINTAFGLSGLLLVLSEDQIWYSRLLIVGAVANGLLNFILIPHWGITGAAIATLIVTIAWNLGAWWRLVGNVGIDCSVWGRAGAYG